jgi:hypothetical protein
MLGIRYGHYSDNVAPAATWSASAPDAAYPAANVADRDPSRPAKLSAGSGYFQADFASPTRVDLVALIHHNLQPGLDVRIQAPASALDVPIVIPAYREDGFPVSPWVDLTAAPGYSAAGFARWVVNVVGANPNPVAIGEIVLLSHIRQLDRNPQWGFSDTENHPLIEHATDMGVVTAYEVGTLTRTYSGQIIASESGAAELRALARDARFRSRGWLFIPDAAVNDAWFVRMLPGPQVRTHQVTDANPMAFTVEEIARGLPL